MKQPPPSPEFSVSTTPSVSATATAASTALPPCLRTFNPAWVASGCTEATMPRVAVGAATETGPREAASRLLATRAAHLIGGLVKTFISVIKLPYSDHKKAPKSAKRPVFPAFPAIFLRTFPLDALGQPPTLPPNERDQL